MSYTPAPQGLTTYRLNELHLQTLSNFSLPAMCKLLRFNYEGKVVKKRQHKINTANLHCKTCTSDLRSKINKGSRDEILNFLLYLKSCGYDTAALARKYTEKKAQSENKGTRPHVNDEDRAAAIQDCGDSLMETQDMSEKEKDMSAPTSRTPAELSDKVSLQGGIDLLEEESIIYVKPPDPLGKQDASTDGNISRLPPSKKNLTPQGRKSDKVRKYSAKISSTSGASIRKKQSIEHESDAIFAARLQAEFYRESRPRRSGK